MLVSTGLVMLMVPGLALFYGGMVRRKNVLGTMMHSMVALAIVGIQWVRSATRWHSATRTQRIGWHPVRTCSDFRAGDLQSVTCTLPSTKNSRLSALHRIKGCSPSSRRL